ncbi:hypothetical protein KIN20_035688 [Parelaphostrongylus tenuis]|uniref:Uncharacterized protein n=1 Tax=Parelaphostrongylus tenuis TaxID=148309 RepID=A0AAD5RBI4_PARTN|nr:hypothetical protein KIN20_035688 [Parelaphostrongylus tenuis]
MNRYAPMLMGNSSGLRMDSLEVFREELESCRNVCHAGIITFKCPVPNPLLPHD